MKKHILLVIIILITGCSVSVDIEQRYFISSILKNECLVSSYLRVYNYNHPFDTISEDSETSIVNCDNVELEMTKQYEILGPLKIKLENKFK